MDTLTHTNNRRALALPIVLGTLLAACATPGDFGDAPDGGPTGYAGGFAQLGRFPTLSINGGAMIADTEQARLGPLASAERDANDPADPDGRPNLDPANTDTDDGLVDFVVVLVAIPPPAAMTVDVTAPPGSAGGAYWLNALIDLDLDGRWGGTAGPGLPEWVVKNFPVQVVPGTSTRVALPPFSFGFGNRLPDGAWMRVVLSREPVGGTDWDGTGSFSAGEVEDHVVSLPVVGANKKIVIQMVCPRRVPFPARAAAVLFRCDVHNTALGATAGTFSYRMQGLAPNGASVQVLPRMVAARGCLAPCPACTAGGPVDCGNPAMAIPIAGAGPVPLWFRANKVGPLPSQWAYSGNAEDPPARVTPDGIVVGHGPSTGGVHFEEVEIGPDAVLEISGTDVVVVVRARQAAEDKPMRVPVGPGERFGGMSHAEFLERGAGPVRLPAPTH
jgi:hypothetical protein